MTETTKKEWIICQLKDAMEPFEDMTASELTDEQIYSIYVTVVGLTKQADEAFDD